MPGAPAPRGFPGDLPPPAAVPPPFIPHPRQLPPSPRHPFLLSTPSLNCPQRLSTPSSTPSLQPFVTAAALLSDLPRLPIPLALLLLCLVFLFPGMLQFFWNACST